MAFNYRCKENATLVLDEFPYLVQKDPALPSTLQRILDRRITGVNELRCNIIICGSSQRMMHGLLQGSEPLYGRADRIFILRPVKLPWWQEIINTSAKELVEEYSIWGGVPQYWSQRERFCSLDEAIQELILDEMGNLYDEPTRLFMDEVSDIAPYSSNISSWTASSKESNLSRWLQYWGTPPHIEYSSTSSLAEVYCCSRGS